MHTVTSFRAAVVGPEEVTGIMADYLALEQARSVRRLLVVRFGVLAVVAGMAGGVVHWLSPFASWFSVGVFLVPPVSTWIVELRRDHRLARRLDELPKDATHVVLPNSDVIKS
jgi:Flp pilus assembly protein TadB